MLRNIPKKVEDELFENCKDSYRRGINVRRTGIRYSIIALMGMLIAVGFLQNVSDVFSVAVALSVSTLCIVWAIYSVSASLNMQGDMVTRLLVHYAEMQSEGAMVESDAEGELRR